CGNAGPVQAVALRLKINHDCPDYAKCSAGRYISIPLYKNLYLFVQQKKPLNQRLFFFGYEKRRPPFVDGRLCYLM
ncbi:hypothetical protein, partial [Collinsella sp. TF07-1]|uniref:hypothetical protein n=1 Tax=Collinsella sp. TF07-1 TaxID=2292332 RepID=UPI001F3D5A73